jgi:eukaryotic-like serine/threonine-protein kinase
MHEEPIFAAALEKLTPAEREAYLEAACAGDAELRRRVDALLKAHEQSGDLLDQPTDALGPTGAGMLESAFAEPTPAKPVAERPGNRIGP